MRKHSYITMVLGVLLVGLSVMFLFRSSVASPSGIIGLALIWIGWKRNRTALVILGHACIVVGAYLIAWGAYLLPQSSPTLTGILLRPLFWGIFCLFGGFCAIFHGFCHCMINFRTKG